jgi:hypothetical protein
MIYPALIPALPRPAIALPIIRAAEFWDTPQSRDPSSNIATAAKKTHLMGKKVYNFPYISWKEHVVRKLA